MLEEVTYCPILHTRLAEMKALFQLPAASKDLLFPLVVSRPWPNAKVLQRTWDKIEEAFGRRRFALDLDPSKYGVETGRSATTEFNALFRPDNGFENYYELVDSIRSAIPVLRLDGSSETQLEAQFVHVASLERGLVVRLEHDRRIPIALAISILARFPETVFFIDLGWSRELLLRQIWAAELIGQLSDSNPDVELVVCGSSFPDSFTNIGVRKALSVDERLIFSSLVQRFNVARLKYGDWASTRPPKESSPMITVPRIDLPTSNEWICFRKSEEEGYCDIARRVIADRDWPSRLAIWGTYTIEATAEELPGAIKGQVAAASARVNIHLHRQAHFDAPTIISDGDEPFEDD